MKKIFITSIILVLSFIFTVSSVYAVTVKGYYRKNGTYVNSYERTAPDSSPYNNYGYPGNYNPNTGSITGGSADAYLNNYYKSSGSTYSPTPSYPSTPTCPSNSYYDGISSCKCSYGYVVSGGSCVSANSMCYSQLGYSSSYDSSSNSCKCDSGYVIGASGQCTSASSVCSNQLGIMSQYNSLSNKCECMSGYEFNGSSCVYKTTSYSNSSAYSASSYTSPYTCPLNSHTSSSDSTKCQCDTGYQANSDKNACVIIPVPVNNAPTSCPVGTILKGNGCRTYTEDCQLSFGDNVVGSAGANNNSTCNCANGYIWNPQNTQCIKTPPAVSQSSSNTVNDLTRQINNLLATIASLQEKIVAASAKKR